MQINGTRDREGAKQEGRKEVETMPILMCHQRILIVTLFRRYQQQEEAIEISTFPQDRQGLQGGGAAAARARSPFFRNFGNVEMVEIREKFETEILPISGKVVRKLKSLATMRMEEEELLKNCGRMNSKFELG